ncbi:1-deoxy-D-xylulose-5-phosphate synthase [Candidatus Aerophobetes bacterium]|nr:1-deoxy-D-xylulose-5-phosphate synthase [Candidatus Aerophobetes bacterium]
MLDKVNNPGDLKSLSFEELRILAGEIRELIIRTVAQNGGHLSSNLGIVEISLALHYVFDTPRDKIIWDVGHQCYTHKILTGRRDKFSTIRQYNGISGFPRREESIYDTFNTGHSSTSISASLGIACARDLQKKDYSVVAVIGDGALTSGIAYEALNNAGALKKRLIIILNDNEMSISPNIGALSFYLNRLRTDPRYNKAREEFKSLLEKNPFLKKTDISKFIKTAEKKIKELFIPGVFFEELGIRYFGPVNGHNLEELIKIFKRIKNLKETSLIHVITKKGKGYPFSEKNPSLYHSASPFDYRTGRIKEKKERESWSNIFGRTIIKLAKKEKKIIAITAAMERGTELLKFKKQFPERFFDTGIAEEHTVTFAAGLASQGYKPVVAIYSTFLQRAYDQILHDVALPNLPVVFAIDRAGIVGPDGPTHQGIFDIAYLRHLPHLIITAPATEIELQNMLYTAIKSNSPFVIRYPKGEVIKEGKKSGKFNSLKIGKAEVIEEGKDVAILALGSMVKIAKEASQELKEKKINPTVVNMRFVKPLDTQLILYLTKKITRIITVEEGILKGGFGSAVIELLQDEGIRNCQVKRIGLPDKFIEQGERERLLKKYGLSREGIIKAVEECLKE